MDKATANNLNWISMEDRQPKVPDHVLVTDGKGLISTAVWWGFLTQKEVDEGHGWSNKSKVGDPYWVNQHIRLTSYMIHPMGITHWLPIEDLVKTLPNYDPNYDAEVEWKRISKETDGDE